MQTRQNCEMGQTEVVGLGLLSGLACSADWRGSVWIRLDLLYELCPFWHLFVCLRVSVGFGENFFVLDLPTLCERKLGYLFFCGTWNTMKGSIVEPQDYKKTSLSIGLIRHFLNHVLISSAAGES